jgi:hypothetical protein
MCNIKKIFVFTNKVYFVVTLSEKLILDKGKVASIPFTLPIQVLLDAREVLVTCKK